MPTKGRQPIRNWTESNGARDRVAELLEESGTLLESHLSEICQAFSGDHRNKKGVRLSAEAITYGHEDNLSSLRQIDHRVSLYKEFILDERTGVQLMVDVLAEAKFRRDVEIVGADLPKGSYRPRLPLAGFLHGSRLSRGIESLTPFEGLPLMNPVLLEIAGGTTPKKVYGENLVHNAAASLYDFITFDLKEATEAEVVAEEEKILSDMGLPQRFQKYLAETHYWWAAVLRDWMAENLTDTHSREFNRRLGAGRVYHSVHGYVPILFLNGEVWRYLRPGFKPCDSLLTRVRVPNWPGGLRASLIRYTVEAPLLVTNAGGLRSLLDSSLEWFFGIEKALRVSDETFRPRWPIEAAFFKALVKRELAEHPERSLRSDLDTFQWL